MVQRTPLQAAFGSVPASLVHEHAAVLQLTQICRFAGGGQSTEDTPACCSLVSSLS